MFAADQTLTDTDGMNVIDETNPCQQDSSNYGAYPLCTRTLFHSIETNQFVDSEQIHLRYLLPTTNCSLHMSFIHLKTELAV